jgi:hypothetical protein
MATLKLIALNQPSSRPSSNGGGRIRLADLDPSVVAKQLMRMESELFGKILPSDCAAWVKNISDEELLNIRRFSRSNYRVSCQTN